MTASHGRLGAKLKAVGRQRKDREAAWGHADRRVGTLEGGGAPACLGDNLIEPWRTTASQLGSCLRCLYCRTWQKGWGNWAPRDRIDGYCHWPGHVAPEEVVTLRSASQNRMDVGPVHGGLFDWGL